MRLVFATLAILIAGAAGQPTQADPYKWCANYRGGDTAGAGSCYFLTIEQCQAQVSGMGGFCEPNQFYDGKPVVTPEDPPPEPAVAPAPAPRAAPSSRAKPR